MGFGDRWIRWMKICVMCVRVLVLVNGSAGEEFQIAQGVEVGLPIITVVF